MTETVEYRLLREKCGASNTFPSTVGVVSLESYRASSGRIDAVVGFRAHTFTDLSILWKIKGNL